MPPEGYKFIIVGYLDANGVVQPYTSGASGDIGSDHDVAVVYGDASLIALLKGQGVAVGGALGD